VAAHHPRLHGAAASFWREWYRELRRQAGNERLPSAIRTRLRGAADRALRRSTVEEARAIVRRVDRRAIAAAAPAAVSPEDLQRACTAAAARGLAAAQPIAAIEAVHRPERMSDAIALLTSRGYQIAWLGEAGSDSQADRSLLAISACVVCSSAEVQHAAYLSQTPSLRLDARDPLTAYPIRREGLFTLATAIDLDTGRALEVPKLLTEPYFRNTRNCGYRPTSGGDIAAAVEEMLDGIARGWSDSPAQARFRTAAADAGVALGARLRHIVEWDAASGFVGDGRLARVQAERAL
jgi:hypothetical protein